MNSRLGLMGLLMVGCLAVFPAMNGCTDDTDPDTTNTKGDAGPVDAGKPDGGADAGPPARTIGSDCATPGGQSNCARGQLCVSFGDVNYCTKTECEADEDCGSFNEMTNVCYPFSDVNACLRGCDPADFASCVRPELACYSVTQDNSVGVCFPRCESDLDCAYGAFCHDESGTCRSTPCGAGNTCSDPNQVCYVRTQQGQTTRSCVDKCSATAPCRPGYECTEATGICSPIQRAAYETCGDDIGVCPAGTECAALGDGVFATCIKEGCTEDADCPAGPEGTKTAICQKGSSNGQSLAMCVLPCSPTANPSECPADNACMYQFPASLNPDPANVVFCGGDQLP